MQVRRGTMKQDLAFDVPRERGTAAPPLFVFPAGGESAAEQLLCLLKARRRKEVALN